MCGGGKPERPAQPYRNDPAVKAYYNPATPGDEWEKWETAYYMFQKEENARIQREQMAAQEGFMHQQAAMQQQQMELQAQLQQQQLEAQQQLQAMQDEMQRQQLEAQKRMESQRLKFEKDAEIAQRDSQRKLEQTNQKSEQQARFQAGRDARNRKNSGNLLASKGTRTLQIGLNPGAEQSSGLAING